MAGAVVVLAEGMLDFGEDGAVKHLAGRDAVLLHDLVELVLLHAVVADVLDVGDHRALPHDDPEHAALVIELHVVEVAGRIELLYAARDSLAGERVAYPERQVYQNGPERNPLQSLYFDILDHTVCAG